MSDEHDKVRRLPVAHRPHAAALELVVTRPPGECDHRQVTYFVDESEKEVVCGGCKMRLNPVWVIAQLAAMESRWRRHVEAYRDAMQRYEKRVRCKCEHCGKMTRIRGM